MNFIIFFFFSSRRRHTRYWRDWSSDVCSSDLTEKFLFAEFQLIAILFLIPGFFFIITKLAQLDIQIGVVGF